MLEYRPDRSGGKARNLKTEIRNRRGKHEIQNTKAEKQSRMLKISISRKEAKESHYWLRLLFVGEDKMLQERRESLVTEAYELMNIFGAILAKFN